MSDDLYDDSEENVVMETKDVVTKSTPKPKKKSDEKEEVKLTPKGKVDKRSVKSEEARKEMLERLEGARVKATEAKKRKKEERDLMLLEEKVKVEKVNSYLKNEDLFEKKYADKFEKITDMLTNVETHLSEVKELKKKKYSQKELDKQQLLKEKEQEKKDLLAKALDESKYVPVSTPAKSTVTKVPILPNYRAMTFGRRGNY